jgi:hypothetical protein
MYEAGCTYENLKSWLEDEQDTRASVRTIKKWMQEWGVRKRMTKDVDRRVKQLVEAYFYESRLRDKEMLVCLKDEGYNISKWALVRVRYQLGLKRRAVGAEHQAAADELVRRICEEGLKEGLIDGYGREYLFTHFRLKRNCIARDRPFRMYRTLNPEGVERRRRDVQRRRGEYIVPGPNFIWSVDGHDKLKEYGIEIYAGVDAYSRYVTWIYVGVSSGTSISVVRQFLNTVQAAGCFPQYVRSDCGNETAHMSYAQHLLAQNTIPDIKFEDCYMYGTSTANQRIEVWWAFLSKGLLFRWRVSLSCLPYEYLS